MSPKPAKPGQPAVLPEIGAAENNDLGPSAAMESAALGEQYRFHLKIHHHAVCVERRTVRYGEKRCNDQRKAIWTMYAAISRRAIGNGPG